MIITVTKERFIDEFERCGKKDQFSREALESLFEYFEKRKYDRDWEDELDVETICREWDELNREEFLKGFAEIYIPEYWDVLIEDVKMHKGLKEAIKKLTYRLSMDTPVLWTMRGCGCIGIFDGYWFPHPISTGEKTENIGFWSTEKGISYVVKTEGY
tara:strand:- start:1911 stop:2384 length:474 start_codon:yes stop_codon:yes gene_type:complete